LLKAAHQFGRGGGNRQDATDPSAVNDGLYLLLDSGVASQRLAALRYEA
jgi:hypothetical protein